MARECSHLYFNNVRELCSTLEEFDKEYHVDVLSIIPEHDNLNVLKRYLVILMWERRGAK